MLKIMRRIRTEEREKEKRRRRKDGKKTRKCQLEAVVRRHPCVTILLVQREEREEKRGQKEERK
jgi:hypothetical protein